MVSGQNKKLKVAWICHFSNLEIQQKLHLKKTISENAVWITGLLELFKNDKRVELHVISPHRGITKDTLLENKGIFFYLFHSGIPFINRHWPFIFRFDVFTRYFQNKLAIKRIIKKINPDIIHLHGAENAYYSSSIFQFKNKYPVFVTIQGFISNNSQNRISFFVKDRIKIELKILKSFKHFGIRTKTMGKQILKYNPRAHLHWHNYPINYPDVKQLPKIDKKYDIVFFARVTHDKGIEDLLRAVALIKKTKKDISAIIIGKCMPQLKKELDSLIDILDIKENIFWKGFLPSQNEVHESVLEARISVLPTKNDIIPGTILESILLKIPVVAYNAGSIHELNEKEELVSLIEINDIQGLAKEIIYLLSNKTLAQERVENAYSYVVERYENSRIIGDIIKAYNDTILNF